MRLESIPFYPMMVRTRLFVVALVAFIGSLCLLAGSVRYLMLASQLREDVAKARTLEFDSLWTLSLLQNEPRAGISELALLQSERTSLMARHSEYTKPVESAWQEVLSHYEKTGAIDWKAVVCFRNFTDSLYAEIVSKSQTTQRSAISLLIMGLLSSLIPLSLLRRFVQNTAREIEARRIALEVTQVSQSRLNHAQAIAHLGSWEFNFETMEATWSDEMYRLHEMNPGEAIPTPEEYLVFIHPEDRARVKAHMSQSEQGRIEFRLLLPSGKQRTILGTVEVARDEAGRSIRVYGTSMDITALRDAEAETHRALAFKNAILNACNYSIISTTPTGVITSFNHGAERLLGYEAEELINRNTSAVLHVVEEVVAYANVLSEELGEHVEPGFEVFVAKARLGMTDEREWTYIRKDGTRIPVLLSVTALYDSAGELGGFLGIAQDITERKRYESDILEAHQRAEAINTQIEQQILFISEQAVELEMQTHELSEANRRLEALAITDGLTGLHNHRAFQERLKEEWNRTQRYFPALSVILMDVDKFKSYNDTFGHPEGDKVLKTVATLLREASRNTDYVCRYGGEEFVVILPHTDREGARAIAERLRVAIASHDWELRPVTASFGIATLEEGIESTKQLIAEADRALYASKRGGRNRVTHCVDINAMDSSDALLGVPTLPITNAILEISQATGDPLATAQEMLREMLTSSYDSVVCSMAGLLDQMEGEERGHSQRLADAMERLATRAGMNAEETLYARWGALLHDVGTVCLPKGLLSKSGVLSPEERALMQNHVQIAYDAFKKTPFLRPALEIPYCHHEHWDGSGYPRGLVGNDIPVVARLFTVLDTYDALTHDRPYRNAMTPERAIEEIRGLEGTQFDPRAVALFVEMLGEESGQRESITQSAA